MIKSHMTKLYWYDTELKKLIRIGYAPGEAHKIVMDTLITMDNIEWYEPNNNLTVTLDNKEALR